MEIKPLVFYGIIIFLILVILGVSIALGIVDKKLKDVPACPAATICPPISNSYCDNKITAAVTAAEKSCSPCSESNCNTEVALASATATSNCAIASNCVAITASLTAANTKAVDDLKTSIAKEATAATCKVKGFENPTTFCTSSWCSDKYKELTTTTPGAACVSKSDALKQLNFGWFYAVAPKSTTNWTYATWGPNEFFLTLNESKPITDKNAFRFLNNMLDKVTPPSCKLTLDERIILFRILNIGNNATPNSKIWTKIDNPDHPNKRGAMPTKDNVVYRLQEDKFIAELKAAGIK